jgi:small subunit ribosomal protein S18
VPVTGIRQEEAAINRPRSSRREAVAKLKKEEIDYKRLDVLAQFLTPAGKVEAARRTGANRKQQNLVARAIKRARYLALLPYSRDDAR